MAAHTVKLLRPSALQLDANTPCVLEIHMPMTLPHRLDPSLPAPPYHAGTITAEDFRDDHAMPLLRGLMARPPWRPRQLQKRTIMASAGFDFAAGYWRDMHGNEGHGTIHAYEDVGDWIEVLHGFKFHLMNPRVLRLDVEEEDGGSGGGSGSILRISEHAL
ncbi:uncharacterized protein B0T15DRAFT_484683 [Chaetomium strumarium]|uniref:Uncharacterized protein n=1 Tax=Chaetomium strumarium TaxID=1170767 RepID=A0AAJ0GXM9_9PEZI|nr:hypothetical protein B0T15DRAFT_484683 [Chaetomium strumarium]